MRIALIFLLLAGITRADLVVSGGYLVVKDGTLNSAGTTTVADGAVLRIHEPCYLQTALLHILAGGLVEGCGTILAEVLNEGEIVANCGTGSAITFVAAVTNHGTVRAASGSGILADEAPFANLGVLDLIAGDATLPAGLSGSGTVVTADSLPPLGIAIAPEGSVTLRYQAYRAHRYRVVWSDDLPADDWQALATDTDPLDESGPRTLTDPDAGLPGKRFYHYLILE